MNDRGLGVHSIVSISVRSRFQTTCCLKVWIVNASYNWKAISYPRVDRKF